LYSEALLTNRRRAKIDVERVVDSKATPQNIQDAFLNTARRERSTVTIYLMHGAKLSGRIKSFDKFSVLLEAGSQEQLIFKHAISTISHARRNTGDIRHPHPPPPQSEEDPAPAGDSTS
jgi:host factor-I protein